MRLLRINGRPVDLDDITSIGITFQAFDIKEPGSRKVKYSNTFTIPATANNLSIIGDPANRHSLSLAVYYSMSCEYYEDNLHIVSGGKCRVDSVSDRIAIYIYEKKDVWESIKDVKFSDFAVDFVRFLGLPTRDNPVNDTFPNFLQPYTVATSGVYLPYFFSNLYGVQIEGGTDYIEKPNQLFLHYLGWAGGHFCVYWRDIFRYIEHKYGVNFATDGGVLPGNVWSDTYARAVYRPLRSLSVKYRYPNLGWYFDIAPTNIFEPHGEQTECEDKTLYDVVNCFLQHFNILIDEVDVNGVEITRMARWDDIDTAEVVDWSGRLTGIKTFKPTIDGYAQKNIIKYGEVYEGGAETAGAKTLISNNRNLDASTELFSVDAYYPAVIKNGNVIALDLTTETSINNNMVLIDGGTVTSSGVYYFDSYQTYGATLSMRVAAVYAISGEYRFLDTVIKYPKFYEITKWLTTTDVLGIEFFKQYYFDELGCSCFINKIANFNPSKGMQPTKIELIKLSERTPVYPPDIDYWMDGVTDPWTDGIGDYWF